MPAFSVSLVTGAVLAGWAAQLAGESAPDGDLMRQTAAGNTSAFEQIYDRHARPVFSLLLRMTRDRARAEDLTQEVFFRAWQLAARFDPAALSALPWLLVMARNRALDLIRSAASRRELATAPEEFDFVPGPELAEVRWLEREMTAQVRKAMANLSDPERQVIELAYFEGHTQVEISQQLNAPLGTVKTWTRSALAKLRRSLP